MTDKEKLAKKQNVEQTIAKLKQDTVQEAKVLTALYEEKRLVLADISDLENQKVLHLKEIEEAENRVKSEKNRLVDEQKQMENERQTHREELKELLMKQKQMSKALSWLNNKILNAEEESSKLDTVLTQKRELLLDLNNKLAQKGDLEGEIDKLIDKTEDLKKKHESLKVNYELQIKSLEKKLEVVRLDAEEYIKKSNMAQYALKQYTDQLERKKKDVHIVVKRLEAKYRKAYPNLRLKV